MAHKDKKGFTLAEVLVTLAVIGVVAALTIPGLYHFFKERQWKTSYKHSYSDISRAVLMGIADNEWASRTTTFDAAVTAANFNVLKQYFGIIKDCDSNNNSGCWDPDGEKALINQPREDEYAFIDKSGRAWSLYYNEENIILVDVNNFKPPNKYGQDRWLFFYADRHNARIGNAGATSTLPEKVKPFSGDYTTYSLGWCEYPPCYYHSWLLE